MVKMDTNLCVINRLRIFSAFKGKKQCLFFGAFKFQLKNWLFRYFSVFRNFSVFRILFGNLKFSFGCVNFSSETKHGLRGPGGISGPKMFYCISR